MRPAKWVAGLELRISLLWYPLRATRREAIGQIEGVLSSPRYDATRYNKETIVGQRCER